MSDRKSKRHFVAGALCSSAATAALFGASREAFGQQFLGFTPGDAEIYRVGTGAAALSNASTAVFIDEYSPTGTLVQSIALPTAASGTINPLTSSGNSTAEGLLNATPDGRYLLIPGYDVAPGTTGVAASAATAVPREVGVFDGTTNTLTSTTTLGTSFTGGSIRSAASADASSLYASGSNAPGIVNITAGSSATPVTIFSTVVNLRDLNISNNQLYASTASGSSFRIASIGTGLPTTTGQTATPVPGTTGAAPAAPYAFSFVSVSNTNDELYVADGAVIDKYSLSNNTYTLTGTITGVTGSEGLTATVVAGTTNVQIYATGTGGLYSFLDTTGAGSAASGAASLIAAAPTNEAFRGVVSVPEPASGGIALMIVGASMIRRRKSSSQDKQQSCL